MRQPCLTRPHRRRRRRTGKAHRDDHRLFRRRITFEDSEARRVLTGSSGAVELYDVQARCSCRTRDGGRTNRCAKTVNLEDKKATRLTAGGFNDIEPDVTNRVQASTAGKHPPEAIAKSTGKTR